MRRGVLGNLQQLRDLKTGLRKGYESDKMSGVQEHHMRGLCELAARAISLQAVERAGRLTGNGSRRSHPR